VSGSKAKLRGCSEEEKEEEEEEEKKGRLKTASVEASTSDS
jgi:hypothetical protein